jgi:hypothetical protein
VKLLRSQRIGKLLRPSAPGKLSIPRKEHPALAAFPNGPLIPPDARDAVVQTVNRRAADRFRMARMSDADFLKTLVEP